MARGMFGGLTLKELAVRTWKESNEDNVFGGAAQLAYYFLLALFPMMIFLVSLVGFIPGLQESLFKSLASVVPGDAMKLVRDTLNDVVSNRNGGLLSIGLLGTVWAASSGVAAVMETLNVAYDVKEERSFIKMRATAVGLTVALAVLFIGGTGLIMFGDKLAEAVSNALNLGPAFAAAWHVVDYILGLAMLFIGIQVIYYFGPNVKQPWKWITPGAVFAVGAIILGSLAFSLYLRYAPDYSATYGSLGAVIILMLWLYLLGLVILFGGEINSEIAHAANKKPDKKGSGERLKAA
jgi:membrane protein